MPKKLMPKRCPFCGHPGPFSITALPLDEGMISLQVECGKCQAAGPAVPMTQAEANTPAGSQSAQTAWNKRARQRAN